MVLKESIRVDDDSNGLILSPGDIDGFHICEIEGKGKVYVYYTEIEALITCLQKV